MAHGFAGTAGLEAGVDGRGVGAGVMRELGDARLGAGVIRELGGPEPGAGPTRELGDPEPGTGPTREAEEPEPGAGPTFEAEEPEPGAGPTFEAEEPEPGAGPTFEPEPGAGPTFEPEPGAGPTFELGDPTEAAGVPQGLEGSRVEGAFTGGATEGTAHNAWVARDEGGGTASGSLEAVLGGAESQGGSGTSAGGGGSMGVASGVGGVLRGCGTAPTSVRASVSASNLAVVRGGGGGDPREVTRRCYHSLRDCSQRAIANREDRARGFPGSARWSKMISGCGVGSPSH
jgi:hypothetical protein